MSAAAASLFIRNNWSHILAFPYLRKRHIPPRRWLIYFLWYSNRLRSRDFLLCWDICRAFCATLSKARIRLSCLTVYRPAKHTPGTRFLLDVCMSTASRHHRCLQKKEKEEYKYPSTNSEKSALAIAITGYSSTSTILCAVPNMTAHLKNPQD